MVMAVKIVPLIIEALECVDHGSLNILDILLIDSHGVTTIS